MWLAIPTSIHQGLERRAGHLHDEHFMLAVRPAEVKVVEKAHRVLSARMGGRTRCDFSKHGPLEAQAAHIRLPELERSVLTKAARTISALVLWQKKKTKKKQGF
jgi:hypothetical protein